MAMGQRRPTGADPRPTEPLDAEWFALTEGMEAYERFRFIARHVLAAALEEARAYATDDRIFSGLEDDDALEDHLTAIDEALREDAALTPMERRFLCAAVAEAMAGHDLQAACPWEQLVQIAAARQAADAEDHVSEL